jgi:transcription elongation factor SPT6
MDGQFLQILKAEADGLVTLSIQIEEEDRLMEDLIRFMCNDYANELAGLWNEQRKLIAEQAAHEIIFPQTVKWLKEKLATAATERIALLCQANLEKKISMAPYVVPDSEEDTPVVLAISWGDGTRMSSAFAVLLNENGELVELLKIDKLVERERSQDVKALQDLINRGGPDIIVLGGFKPNTKTALMKILKEEVISFSDKKGLEVILVDDEVPRIYMNSKQASRNFPEADYPRLIPYCVSLGRLAQDPTCEYAGLFNNDNDITHLRLDTIQTLVRLYFFLIR